MQGGISAFGATTVNAAHSQSSRSLLSTGEDEVFTQISLKEKISCFCERNIYICTRRDKREKAVVTFSCVCCSQGEPNRSSHEGKLPISVSII